jgi:hypothetical protein
MATGYQLTPEEQRNLAAAEAAGAVSAQDLAAIRSGRAAQTFNQPIANQGVRAGATGNAATPTTGDFARADRAPPKANAVAIKKSTTAVAGLIDSLNAAEQKLVADGVWEVANVYKIRFEPAALGDSKVTKFGKPNKAKVPMQQSVNPADNVNPNTNSVSYDIRTFDYSPGTPIVVILDQILQNSSYIADQAAYMVDEPGQKTKPQKPLGELAWYKISVETSRIKHDAKRRDYAYNITYIISAYAINSMLSQYFPAVPLRGIHKSYKYWFTGQNTQVVRFEQKFNSAYTLTFTNATVPSDQRALYQQLGREAPKVEYQAAVGSGSSQGAEGITNSIGASAADYLYSPTDIAKVELTIVGDPAWLQQGESGAGISSLGFDFNPFNADGGINFDSQEIIFDLQWNTVADYDVNGTGLANPNKTPNTTQASQTYIYRASELTSKFSKGKFEQDLKGTLFEIADTRRDPPSDGSSDRAETARLNRQGNAADQTAATQARTGVDLTNASAGGGRGNGQAQLAAEQARLAASSTTGVNPTSSLAQGTQAALSPPTVLPAPTLTQLQSSPAYIAARRSGETPDAALQAARTSFAATAGGSPVVSNGQAIATGVGTSPPTLTAAQRAEVRNRAIAQTNRELAEEYEPLVAPRNQKIVKDY